MTTTLFGITWTLANLLWMPLFVALCGIIIWKYVQSGRMVDILVHPKWQRRFLNRYSPLRAFIKSALLVTGLLGLFIALLHPSWGKREEVVTQQGRDLFIALDISRSMLGQDLKPNRLAHAKEKIKTLVSKLSAERVGLVLFAGTSFVQCPLTSDYAAFYMFLDAVGAETVSSGTTAFDQVINKVITLFQGMPVKKNKLLVMFTDGEDFSSNLASIKQKAQDIGLHIFTIGVGTSQGAPVPIIDDYGQQKGVERDANGNVIMSRLNEGILSTLAHATGGTYIGNTPDTSDVMKLVRLVESYEKERIEDKKVVQQEEQYPYVVAVSLLCLLLEWLL